MSDRPNGARYIGSYRLPIEVFLFQYNRQPFYGIYYYGDSSFCNGKRLIDTLGLIRRHYLYNMCQSFFPNCYKYEAGKRRNHSLFRPRVLSPALAE